MSWLDYKYMLRPNKEKDMEYIDPFENECLWNDRNVVYRGKLSFILDWVSADLSYLKDIWHHNDIIPFDEIVRKVGYSWSRLFEYNAIRSAVGARAARVGLGAAPTPTTSDFGEGLSPHAIRLQLVAANVSTPCLVSFRRGKLDIKLEKQQWTQATTTTTTKCTKQSRLQ